MALLVFAGQTDEKRDGRELRRHLLRLNNVQVFHLSLESSSL